MGVRKAYKGMPLGGLLLALLFEELAKQMEYQRLDWAEFSWVLETNTVVTRMAERMCGPPVKTYRLYAKAI